MIPALAKWLPLTALLVVGFGCKEKAPQVLSAEQVPAAVESAFKDATGDAKTTANEVVAAIQSKDEAKALVDLQTLFSRPDLTPEQREAANSSMISLNERLRALAAQGDKKAQEALDTYSARK
jgi:hypothetical protein